MIISLLPPDVANQPFNVHIHQQTIQINNGQIPNTTCELDQRSGSPVLIIISLF